jgi:hypothetical protein
MSAPPALSNFVTAAAELQRQEIACLSDAVVPRLETMRSMTLPVFRAVIADMWQRFGHEIITDPSAPFLVTTKNGRKFITECGAPADPMPTRTAPLRHLNDAISSACADRGFYISARGFTEAAEQYKESGAPIELVDSVRLIKALNQSRKHVLLPQTYHAMCGQCGEIVQHRLGDDEARACGNAHMVAPTIPRALIVPPRPAGSSAKTDASKPAPRPYSRREIRAHNAKYEARLMKKPRP